jgi:nucleoside-diphosphate-sugar epimerase
LEDQPATTGSALVTGGSGFIGRELVARLVVEGWSVVCVGRRDPHVSGARFVQIVQFSDSDLERVNDYRFDTVFHLAAYGVVPVDQNPSSAFDVNVAGTAALVRAAARAGARSFVYTGSCSEYAEAKSGYPIPETHPIEARGLYGASKAAGGLWGQALARQLGLGFAHMRLFGVFGAGEASHRLLPSIVAALRQGQPAKLTSGTQIRDVLHVDDAVDGLLHAAAFVRGGHWPTFNLCSGIPVSVRAMALEVAAAMNAPSHLLGFGEMNQRSNEVPWLVGDNRKFAASTAFQPRVSLQEGVSRAVARLIARDKLGG